jgi:hypothetical protein
MRWCCQQAALDSPLILTSAFLIVSLLNITTIFSRLRLRALNLRSTSLLSKCVPRICSHPRPLFHLKLQLYLMCTAVNCHPVWQLFIPLPHCMPLAQRTLESGQAFSQRQLEQVCNQYSVSRAKHQLISLPLRFRTASWLKS